MKGAVPDSYAEMREEIERAVAKAMRAHTDLMHGEISCTIDDAVGKMEARLRGLIRSAGEGHRSSVAGRSSVGRNSVGRSSVDGRDWRSAQIDGHSDSMASGGGVESGAAAAGAGGGGSIFNTRGPSPSSMEDAEAEAELKKVRLSDAGLPTEMAHGNNGNKAQAQDLAFIAKFSHNEVFGQLKLGDEGDDDRSFHDGSWLAVAKRMNSQFIFRPHSWRRFLWDVLMMLMIIFLSFELPCRLAFLSEVSHGWQVYELLVDIIFFFDLFFNFHTGYFADGLLVKDPARIAMHYARTWLAIDLVSCFPWDWIFSGLPFQQSSNDHEATRSLALLRVVKMSRLLRLLRLTRLYRYFDRWEEGAVFFNSNTLRITRRRRPRPRRSRWVLVGGSRSQRAVRLAAD